RDDTNFSAWMLQIAKNLAFNHLNKAKRVVATDDFSTYSVDAKVDEMTEILNKALSLDERQVVVLHAVAGYKHREIAQIVGKPIGTVTWVYKNALAKLKKYLTQEVGK
ncbi:MAG: RNA polymerase sigma factor, partial [Clostridia bacterium]|nr:RNA polymerase sigma factor [Clostridia bacterium]